MIWNLDPAWLLMVIASVTVMAFFLGSALDSIMRHDGFGPFGNMLLFAGGFLGSVYIANLYGVSLRNLTMACAYGLGGAFALVGVSALVKACLARMAR